MVGVNLIPETTQLVQARRRHMARWGAAVAAVYVALAIPLGIDFYQRALASNLRAEHDVLAGQIATVRVELRELTAQYRQASLQLERANALRAKRAWSDVLAMIGRCLPAGSWLTSIATDPATPGRAGDGGAASHRVDAARTRPTTVAIDAPRMLRITGYATTPAEPLEFVTRLKEAGVFSKVVLERSRSEPALDGSYFRFDLTCEW